MLPESDFINRHIGPRKLETIEMLKQIGENNIEELIDKTIPKNIRNKSELNIGEPMSEARYLEHIQALGRKNKTYRSYIGLGGAQNVVLVGTTRLAPTTKTRPLTPGGPAQ